MPTLTLPIKPHENQKALLRPTARFNVNAAGRRFGKTEIEKLNDIYRVMEGQTVWWVNPTWDNTLEAWLDFLNFFEQFVPRANINKSRRQIFVPGGGSIRMLGADNFKRGPGIDHVTIDEAAFLALENLWQYQLEPMLLESKGTATFLSSTNGRNGFWKMYQRGLDPNEPNWHSTHFTSYDNPMIDKSDIDDIKRNTPERVFKQEYMAEFLDDGGAVFRNLQSCVYGAALNKTANPVVIGVDWARYNDYSVLTVIDTGTKQVVEIDRFNMIDWTLQRGRLQSMCKRYDVQAIYAEANSIGEPNIEELQKSGLPVISFTTTASSKAQIINQLALAFEQEDIGIPNDPTLLGELQAYTLERLPSGNFRYTAPSGLHDDMVMSLALAWHALFNAHYMEDIQVPDWYFDDTGHSW